MHKKAASLLLWCLAISLVIVASGCELDDDKTDHIPPAGFGAMIIDNRTAEDIRVFVDGADKGEVSDFTDRPFDLRPGTYRVVLDQENSRRSWRGDVDILADRLTILEISEDIRDLDAIVYFD